MAWRGWAVKNPEQVDSVRCKLLSMDPDERVELLRSIDICRGCGTDLRRDDGTSMACYCENDE